MRRPKMYDDVIVASARPCLVRDRYTGFVCDIAGTGFVQHSLGILRLNFTENPETDEQHHNIRSLVR